MRRPILPTLCIGGAKRRSSLPSRFVMGVILLGLAVLPRSLAQDKATPPSPPAPPATEIEAREAGQESLRGMALARAGKDGEARAAFEKAIQLDPTRFDYYQELDGLLSKQGEWPKLILYWSQFIQLVPNNEQAYCERGGAYSHLHDRPDQANALKDAQKACSLDLQTCCQVAMMNSPANSAAPTGSFILFRRSLFQGGWAMSIFIAAIILLGLIVVLRALMPRGNRVRMVGAGLFLLLGMSLLPFALVNWELISQGQRAEATVISDRFAYNSSGRSNHHPVYKAIYQFYDYRRVIFMGRYYTNEGNLAPGTLVAVVYFTDDPAVSEPLDSAIWQTMVSSLAIAAAMIIASYLFIRFILRQRFESQLLQVGVETTGTVRAVVWKYTSGRSGPQKTKPVFQYTFQDRGGQYHSGKDDLPSGSNLVAGSTITVVYDPEHPDQNMVKLQEGAASFTSWRTPPGTTAASPIYPTGAVGIGTPSGPPTPNGGTLSVPPGIAVEAPNGAAALTYLPIVGWFIASAFVIYRDNKFVRFHAFQSIFLGIGFSLLSVLTPILNPESVPIPAWASTSALVLVAVVSLGVFTLQIFMMFKAMKNEKFKLPVIGDMAEKAAG